MVEHQSYVEQRVQEIKEYSVACMIKYMMRTLTVDDKQLVNRNCDRMLLRERQERERGMFEGNDDRVLL